MSGKLSDPNYQTFHSDYHEEENPDASKDKYNHTIVNRHFFEIYLDRSVPTIELD